MEFLPLISLSNTSGISFSVKSYVSVLKSICLSWWNNNKYVSFNAKVNAPSSSIVEYINGLFSISYWSFEK